MTESDQALKEAIQRLAELERRLRMLEDKLGPAVQLALQINPGGNT